MIDNVLIDTVLKKKHWAFTIFYNEIVDHFFSYLKSNFYLSNFEINDIISATFVKIWNKLDTFDNGKWEFVSWCWTILRNTTKDYFKKKKDFGFSDFEYLTDTDEKISLEEKLYDEQNLLEEINIDFQLSTIKNAIWELTYFEREILYLRFTEQKSLNEISQITWLSNSNVRVKLHRSIKKLKEMLKDD